MRKTKQNEAKPVYALLVDGECERWYIEMLRRHERSLNVRLKPELPQRKSLHEQYNKVLALAREYDHVFWIVDYDAIIHESREAPRGKKPAIQQFKEYYQKLQKKKNVTVIVNNPCLEYWLLLHYEPARNQCYDNCGGATAHLRTHCPDYEKTCDYYTRENRDIYLRLRPHLPTAIGHAGISGDFDIETFDPGTACSYMHLLFDKLRVLPGAH